MKKILATLITFLLIFAYTTGFSTSPKKWTFLIFINGNNSLDSYGAYNIKQMEKIGSNDQMNVVVQWASYRARKSLRLLVEKSTDPSQVTSPILQDLGLVDMGDYHSLEDFIKWGVENFPAEHYFIEVWNHGSGWNKKRNSKDDVFSNDISSDDISGHSIKTTELGQVMSKVAKLIGHKVDIYGSDACLMSMIEVANEMSDSVNYFVGSEEVEPGRGWPYDDFLSQWTSISNAQPDQVTKILVDTYVKSYEEGGSSGDLLEVTLSAFDLTKVDDLNAAFNKLNTNILQLSASDRAKVLSIPAQRFAFDDYADLLDFTKNLSQISGIDPQNIANLQNAADKFIIANKTTQKYINAKGLSFWLPVIDRDYLNRSPRYNELKFNLNTHWSDTLRILFQGTKK